MKNEIIYLDASMESSLDRAVLHFTQRNKVSCNFIKYEVEDNNGILKVEIAPTHAQYLYEIFFEMGRLYQAENK